MTWLLAVALGLLIGLTLGALGGGGSILTVPALVYLLHQGPQEATTASLVIVGVTSAVSSVNHARSRNVRWGTGFAFAAAGILASFAGTALNRRVDGQVLLLAFAGLMLASATAMLVRTRTSPLAGENTTTSTASATQAPPAPTAWATRTATHDRANRADRADRMGFAPASVLAAAATAGRSGNSARTAKIVLAGLVVGFLTGFLGVGGGFVIVPALVAALGYAMPVAVGTSLLIIAANSAVSLVARSNSNHFDWSVIVPFTLAAVTGSFVGKRVADRVPAQRLTRAFAVLLVCVAIYVSLRAAFAR